jgi:ATP-dependent RNA helicase DeaD
MKETNFNKLGLSHEVNLAIEEMGFENPTQIQALSIPLILEGRDVIGHSKTGTGKTMAFGLPAVDIVNTKDRATQVLVLCPTRELALQATEEMKKATKHKRGINVVAIYGGAPIDPQTRELKRGAHIVVGTPGRIMDHMRRRRLKLGALKLAVLDEADEMLNMGFRDDMETILSEAPDERNTVLFSATMSKEIIRLTKRFQTDAKLIESGDENLTVANIEQWHCSVSRDKKTDAIVKLYSTHQPKMSLIFCNTKRMVDTLVERLQGHGISAVALHGDLNQHARNRVMAAYRSGKFAILVATDVAARGIDVAGVEMVFNYDIPLDNEYYVHRIGRTGRAGRSGKAVTLVVGKKESLQIRTLERFIGAKIPFRGLPTQRDVEKIEKAKMLDVIKAQMSKKASHSSRDIIDQLMADGNDVKDIACTLLTMMDRKEEKPKKEKRAKKSDYGNTGAERGMVRFFINLGRKDRVEARDIVGCIAGEAKIRGSEIGKIDIFDKFSFVEVPQDRAPVVHSTLGGVSIKGRSLNIEPAVGKQ